MCKVGAKSDQLWEFTDQTSVVGVGWGGVEGVGSQQHKASLRLDLTHSGRFPGGRTWNGSHPQPGPGVATTQPSLSGQVQANFSALRAPQDLEGRGGYLKLAFSRTNVPGWTQALLAAG